MKYMLDTNICIYLIKKKSRKLLEKMAEVRPSDCCISAVSFGELQYGIRKSKWVAQNEVALLEFLSPLEILPFDDEAASVYGRVRCQLEADGKPIGPLDMMIGAHALSHGLVLVTKNQREFHRIRHLQLDNWV